MIKATAAAVLLLSFLSKAHAHDFWLNDQPVPPWVKTYCCGPGDVHQLNPSAVHIRADGYHIDGLAAVIPFDKALPSVDGAFWAFFKEANGPEASIYCFYAPMNGT